MDLKTVLRLNKVNKGRCFFENEARTAAKRVAWGKLLRDAHGFFASPSPSTRMFLRRFCKICCADKGRQ